MKNDPQDLELIVHEIERLACHNNPGPTAEIAVSFIDDTYVLVPRETLPTVNYGTLDDAYGPQTARIDNITENVYDGDTDKMRKLAYQYLAMADYVDAKKKTEAQKALTKLRVEAWKMLHPQSGVTEADLTPAHYERLMRNDKAAVDVIVDLKIQLAKAQEKS